MAPRTPKDPARPATDKPSARVEPPGPLAAVDAPARPAKAAKPDIDDRAQVSTLRLRDLVAEVAKATGAKKPEAKKSVEATLAAVAAALAAGSSLALPPLGKLRVVRTKGPTLTLKLRLAEGAKTGALTLADDGEDS